MDRREQKTQAPEGNEKGGSAYKPIYATDSGKQYQVPYGLVRQVIFSNISRKEMVDAQHAARLQYRLMLMEPVIKARVDFAKLSITVIYNPSTADNMKPKMSVKELMAELKKEGINVNEKSIDDKDYDYREFYQYAFSPAQIRESPPYSYTHDEWERMKPEVMKKKSNNAKKKIEKFHEWQKKYEEKHGNVVH
ncbi:MAG: hypothetical protein QXW10_04145 [Candidatus Micrarchaeaceae archaeon]